MAGTLRDRLREIENERDRWFRERNEQAGRLKQDLEDAGRDAWSAGTRAGVNVVARTPQELQALGARVLDEGKRAAPKLREAALQADTILRGAANVVTFGEINPIAAGLDALIQPGGLGGWRQRYNANLDQEMARDRYDASHRAFAQGAGQLAGTVLDLGLVGPMEGALAAAPRLADSAARSGRETAALLVAGAGTGLGAQTLSDIAAAGRQSSWGDKLGAATGGAVGTAALPLGPARAGAIGASVTSAAQDVFNGRQISLKGAGESAITGNVLGGLAGIWGRGASNGLTSRVKGRLGEALGDLRSRANLQPREWAPKSRDPLSDRYWYPDGRSGSIRFEDKFGTGAELSPNQTQAQAELGPDFRLYHFLPADIGKAFGVPAAAMAPHLTGDQDRW